jgi:hypothetical protein
VCNCALCFHVDGHIDPYLVIVFVRLGYMLRGQVIGPSTMLICD